MAEPSDKPRAANGGDRRGRRTWRRRRWAIAGTGLALALLVALAPVIVRGRLFGRLIETALPPTCGVIRIGGGAWTWSALWALARSRPAFVSVVDVRVTDPEGMEVLSAKRASGRIEIARAPLAIVVHDLDLGDAKWRFARMSRASAIGFVAALRPLGDGPTARDRCLGRAAAGSNGVRETGGARADAPLRSTVAQARSIHFAISNGRLSGLEATFDFPDWGLLLRDVTANGRLDYRQGGGQPSSFTFEVWGTDARMGGALRVLRDGPRALVLPFSRAHLDRVATDADAPDAIVLDASDVVTGRSRLEVRGRFDGVYGRSRPAVAPGMTLVATVEKAGDAADAVLGRVLPEAVKIAGDRATLALDFAGPFSRLRVEARATGFDVVTPAAKLTKVDFAAFAIPTARRLILDRLSFASPRAGRATLSGHFARGEVEVAGAFDGLVLAMNDRSIVRSLAGSTLAGTIAVHANLRDRSGSLEQTDLVWTPSRDLGGAALRLRADRRAAPQAAKAPTPNTIEAVVETLQRRRRSGPRPQLVDLSDVHLSSGTLFVPRIAVPFAGGRFTGDGHLRLWNAAGGDWLPSPVVDLDARVDNLSIARLIGPTFIDGTVSFRASARGPLDALTMRLGFPARASLDLIGTPFRLPATVDLRVVGRELRLRELRLAGTTGGELVLGGRARWDGTVDVTAALKRFPVGRLPGLVEIETPVTGYAGGELQVSIDVRPSSGSTSSGSTSSGSTSSGSTAGGTPPRISGDLRLDAVAIDGRALGGGILRVRPGPGGAIAATGRLFETVSLDGLLVPGPAGFHGRAKLNLAQFRLDPLLGRLPADLTGSGTLTGTLIGHVAPGHRPRLDGEVAELKVDIGRRSPTTTTRTSPSSPRPVRLWIDRGKPLRFSAEPGGGDFRIEPARLMTTVGTFDLATANRGRSRALAMRGRATLGRLAPLLTPWLDHFEGTTDINMSYDVAAGNTVGAIRRLSGEIAIIEPIVLRPRQASKARDSGNDLRKDSPRDDVRILAGRIDLRGDTALIRDLKVALTPKSHLVVGDRSVAPAELRIDPDRVFGVSRVNLPLTGQIAGIETPRFSVDRGAFALRLTGEPARRLRLAGNVDLFAARARPMAKAERAASAPAQSWLSRPEMGTVELDVSVRSRDGAVLVDVPHLPDVRVDVDFRVGGTVARPQPQGQFRGANIYSSFALWLQRLFQ